MTYRTDSLLMSAAAHIVSHYRDSARKIARDSEDYAECAAQAPDTRKLSDDLMRGLLRSIMIEGRDMPNYHLKAPRHKWQALSYALFSIEMFETACILPGRSWGRMWGGAPYSLRVRLASHLYVLGVFDTEDELNAARTAFAAVYGPLPSDLGVWIISPPTVPAEAIAEE